MAQKHHKYDFFEEDMAQAASTLAAYWAEKAQATQSYEDNSVCGLFAHCWARLKNAFGLPLTPVELTAFYLGAPKAVAKRFGTMLGHELARRGWQFVHAPFTVGMGPGGHEEEGADFRILPLKLP